MGGAGGEGGIVFICHKMNQDDIKNELDVIILGKDVNELIAKFKLVNPTYYTLFKNKTEREAIERMAINFGFEEISKIIEILPQTNSMDYAPTITTPFELEKKFAKLISFLKRKGNGQIVKIS